MPGAYVPLICAPDPAWVFSDVVVEQSSPAGVPMPRPSHTEPGTFVPPTLASVMRTVPFCSMVKEWNAAPPMETVPTNSSVATGSAAVGATVVVVADVGEVGVSSLHAATPITIAAANTAWPTDVTFGGSPVRRRHLEMSVQASRALA
jgi:hypothetical protein